FGLGHDLADLFDAAGYGAERHEAPPRAAGDDAGERGFARSGRTPEDHGTELVALELGAQRLAGGEQVRLADELVQIARPHAVGERAAGGGFFWNHGLEQRHRDLRPPQRAAAS